MYFLLVTLVSLPLTSSQGPKWEKVATTFGIPYIQPLAYDNMPLTKSDPKLIAVGNENECNGTFQGYRYKIDSEDDSVKLLYDVNGYIAGIQTSYPASEADQNKDLRKWFDVHPIFDRETFNGKDYYTLTAYLINPEIICTTGRSKEEFTASPSGIDLYLKNGSDLVTIPKKQSDLEGTSWTKGKCFIGMGLHYWYNITEDMNCDYFQPFFLLYNRGYLSALGFAVFATFSNKRYEHPPPSLIPLFMQTMPTCLGNFMKELGPVSTMHVFMNDDPRNLYC